MNDLDQLIMVESMIRPMFAQVSEVEFVTIYRRLGWAQYAVCLRISEIPGRKASEALKEIRQFYAGNATLSLTLDELIAKRRKSRK